MNRLSAVPDRRFDPVLAFLDDVIGQPNGRKAGETGGEVHFDFHENGVDAEKGACVGFGDHGHCL